MTITVGRLLAWTAGLLVVGVVAAYWLVLRPGDSFSSEASKICREQLPAIANAPDFQTALLRSREMRLRLTALTPPDGQRVAFTGWITELKATEDAALAGKMTAVAMHDDAAGRHVSELGLTDSCQLNQG